MDKNLKCIEKAWFRLSAEQTQDGGILRNHGRNNNSPETGRSNNYGNIPLAVD
jgi:hypothetical protein